LGPPSKLRKSLSELTKAHAAEYHFLPSCGPASGPRFEPLIPHTVTNSSTPLSLAIRKLAVGQSLSVEETAAAFDLIMRGEADPAGCAALLMGLRVKGETHVHLPDAKGLVDTCGTGGGRVGTLNISTAAAFVAAGAGARVAKHGNRSHTSSSGSADVLEALGVAIDVSAAHCARMLEESRFAFMYAPAYHPAMRHLGPVRQSLGTPTVMNLIGPLANPAAVRHQVLGVADRARAPLLAAALCRLGTHHALVVHADVGMDEISPIGPTSVWEVRERYVQQWKIWPEDFGLAEGDVASLAGGEPSENARRIESLLEGRDNGDAAVRSAVTLNAGAALYAADQVADFGEGVERARDALASGAGAEVLARVRAVSISG
jgi:anthranilate phosphoribosyltransferase